MLRSIYKFEHRLGTETVRFPRAEASFQSTQALRGRNFNAAGQDYPIRSLGWGPGLKDSGTETLTFVLASLNRCPGVIDGKWDTLVANCLNFGVGKLWSEGHDYVQRWSWAYLDDMPARATALSFNARHIQASLKFIRLSDWYGVEETDGADISASPTSFNIVNPGLTRAGEVVIRLRANAVAGFNVPTLHNGAGAQMITVNKIADSPASEIRIRSAHGVVEYSNDDGGTYANIYDLVTLGTTQAGLMELFKGTNPMIYTQPSGVPDLSVEVSFSPAWVTP